MAEATTAENTQTGILGWVEGTGNKLPDPVFIFFYLIIALVVVSIVASLSGVSALHPHRYRRIDRFALRIDAVSLLSPENIQRLWVEMPATFTHFHPLGYVLVVMLGAGVAERSGFFAAGMSKAVKSAPKSLLTPVVALVAMLGNHAADAGYVVLIPLAGILFAAAGRHPLAGIAAAFAGVSGGFSANISPGQLDALLFGITEEAGRERARPVVDRQYRGQLVLHQRDDLPVPADHLVRYRQDRRATAWPVEGGATAGAQADDMSPDPAEESGALAAKAAACRLCRPVRDRNLWLLMVFAPGTSAGRRSRMRSGACGRLFDPYAARTALSQPRRRLLPALPVDRLGLWQRDRQDRVAPRPGRDDGREHEGHGLLPRAGLRRRALSWRCSAGRTSASSARCMAPQRASRPAFAAAGARPDGAVHRIAQPVRGLGKRQGPCWRRSSCRCSCCWVSARRARPPHTASETAQPISSRR